MAVQFILGRSGTGKSSYCIKAIVDALLEPADNQSLILLVPEQATYQAERAILDDKRVAGYSSGSPFRKKNAKSERRLSVLSFDRLQFLLLGKNTARPGLSRIGRQMIIHRILREHKSELKVLGSSADSPGLSRQMADTIAELHRYAKTPDDIDRLLSELQKDERNNLTGLKFADVSLVFKEYLKFIEGKFIDPDIQLTIAGRAVAEAEFVKGAKLWVDGFAGFTTSELAILAELLKTTEKAQVALCLDPSNIDLKKPDTGSIDPVGLFNPTERTYAELIEIVKKCKLRLAEPIILDSRGRFSHCPQLAHIERNVSEPKPAKIKAADNIRIVSAPNARAEVKFVARQILQLVKEKNYRYRNIGVIASDIGRYQHYIKAYFDDYGLPFFIDRRKPLNQHPAVGLICSALQVVGDGFSHSDIFAYLKTSLVPIESCDVDLLENYCLAFGVNSSDWTDEKNWQFEDKQNRRFDEQYINQIRVKLSKPLLELRDRLCPAGNQEKMIGADEFTRIIFDFLDGLSVCQTISGWIEAAAKAGDYATVDEHRQFHSRFVDVFDELVEVFGGREETCRDFVAIINSAFSQLELAFIPPKLDQVLVGSIERSRHPDLKAVFLIGATQKQFPTPVGFDGLLTDDDRIIAESADFALAAATSQTLAERQYLAYIAFTRPSQFLYVTYPATDEKGSAAVRSQFVDNLESLFEDLSEESISDEQINIENIHSESELADLLCGNERFDKLLDDVCSDEQLGEVGARVKTAVNYDNRAQLDKRIVEKLFGREKDPKRSKMRLRAYMRSSATKLGTFAACPYQYFARYTLKLEERKEFKFEPLDLGKFYHSVLDALLEELNTGKKDFATIKDDELLEILRERIARFVQTDSFISNFARRSRHNTFIITSAGEVLEDCVLGIAEMARAGSFKPSLSEVVFGKLKEARETLGEYKIGLSDNRLLLLNGKIDRLDIANISGEKTAIVFDYKRKEKSFSWPEFYYGLDMQLPIYMLAVRSTSRSKTKNVVGAFYMPVEINLPKASLDELPKKTDSFNYKAKGIFNGEFFRQLDGQACTGWNKFYNFRIVKGGGQYGDYGKSGALKPNDLEKVLRFTEKKIVGLAEEILSGKIDVRPYKLGVKSPCSYCRYKSVCRFDWQINEYNPLVSLGKTEVLEKIADGREKD